MIDHLLAFPDEATAQADPIVGQYFIPAEQPTATKKRGARAATTGSWRGDCCIPGVLLWDPAADVQTVHTPYDSQWRIMIALAETDSKLLRHADCEMVADRRIASPDRSHIIYSTFTQDEINTLMLQPVFMGSTYPFLQGGAGL
jgi:hypothetical protein